MKKNNTMILLGVLALSMTVCGCGKKGEPFLTQGETEVFPRVYPCDDE